MKLRTFLEKAVYECTEDKLTADRITQSMLLDYDFEIKNPKSVFAMKDEDFKNPKNRTQYAFLWKHLPQVDSKKAQRVEELVNLLAMYHYHDKYGTDIYEPQIKASVATIEAEPVPEIDSLMTTEATARGTWSN